MKSKFPKNTSEIILFMYSTQSKTKQCIVGGVRDTGRAVTEEGSLINSKPQSIVEGEGPGPDRGGAHGTSAPPSP